MTRGQLLGLILARQHQKVAVPRPKQIFILTASFITYL